MKYIYQSIVLAFVILIWHIFSSELIPSPMQVLDAFRLIIDNNSLQIGIIDSLYRYGIGLILGVIFGVIIGFIFGYVGRCFFRMQQKGRKLHRNC